jgi:hypothetical protein
VKPLVPSVEPASFGSERPSRIDGRHVTGVRMSAERAGSFMVFPAFAAVSLDGTN